MKFFVTLIFSLATVAAVADDRSAIQLQRNHEGKIVGVRMGGSSSSERLELTAESIAAISRMKDVQSISLSFSTVDDQLLLPIARMPHLVFVDLSFSNVTGKSIETLAQCPKLRLLELTACDVHDKHLAALEKMPQLIHLRLERTKVTDAGLKHIAPLKQLNLLDLQSCEITDAGLESLGQLPQLQHLFLTKTLRYGRDDRVNLTDECVDYLTSLTSLIDLQIGSSNISPDGIQRLKAGLPKATIDTNEHGILYIGMEKPD